MFSPNIDREYLVLPSQQAEQGVKY